MTERPILFSAPMVRAILDGNKTQTRRICKPAQFFSLSNVVEVPDPQERGQVYNGSHFGDEDGEVQFACPYGGRGERLWLRETFAIVPRTAYRCSEGVQQTLRPDDDHDAAIYREGWTRSRGGFRWRPSIHMPRWASRITLEVTGVRVETLGIISHEDALAEGVSSIEEYKALWININGAWLPETWVWVVDFRMVLN